jgi:hypothetical protein
VLKNYLIYCQLLIFFPIWQALYREAAPFMFQLSHYIAIFSPRQYTCRYTICHEKLIALEF